MSNVPDQVRRAAERATELQAQAYPAPAEPTDQVDPPAADPQDPPVDPAPPADPAPADPPAAPAPTPPVENWEQKYKTLQGVFRAESTKWQQKENAYQATIAELRAAPPAPAPAPAASTVVPARDEKDVDTYGPEMLDLVERRATAMATAIVDERLAKLMPQIEKVQVQADNAAQRVYQNDQERFFGELERAVPDYKDIDADPRWLDWLGEADPLSGMPRQAYLDNAGQSMDHARVANLFKAFKDAAGLNPPPAPALAPAPPAMSPSPRPVGAASAPSLQPQTAGSVSRSQIAEHYRRASNDSRYRGSAQHKAFEQLMAAAMAAGTVVEG